MRKTDARVEEALRLTVKKSLQEMGKAINGDHKSKSEAHPLFRVNMVLDEGKGKVEFRPSVKELAELIQQISKESIRTIQVVPRLQDMLEGKEREEGGAGGGEDAAERRVGCGAVGCLSALVLRRHQRRRGGAEDVRPHHARHQSTCRWS